MLFISRRPPSPLPPLPQCCREWGIRGQGFGQRPGFQPKTVLAHWATKSQRTSLSRSLGLGLMWFLRATEAAAATSVTCAGRGMRWSGRWDAPARLPSSLCPAIGLIRGRNKNRSHLGWYLKRTLFSGPAVTPTGCWAVDSSSREFEYSQSPVANTPFPATARGPQAAPPTAPPVNTVFGKTHPSVHPPPFPWGRTVTSVCDDSMAEKLKSLIRTLPAGFGISLAIA